MPLEGAVPTLVVDDHPIVRDGIVGILARIPDVTVVGAVGSYDEAVEVLTEHSIGLALVDLSLPEKGGFALLRHIQRKHPSVRSLVVSLHEAPAYAERSLAEGASGYVKKSEASSVLMDAVRRVLQGRIYVSNSIAMELLDSAAHGRERWDQILSPRELEVFELVGHGRRTREIAEQLFLSVKTVESHLANIRSKLGFRDATELSFQAYHWAASQTSGDTD